jgi:hypothetical protein
MFTAGMRASHQEQTGGAGASEVSAAFQRMGWGVAENTRHDLGTDLFVMARDERLFDLGLVVGVQVKSGPSFFREPKRDSNGALTGWWFRDRGRSHIDYWASHALPHLIVLHDPNTHLSYWVHVTKDAVISTGKGAKVLVPEANALDDEHRDDLLRVAATLRAAPAWEGTAWTGAGSMAPRDVLRHALMVPRLVAPHPNSGYRAPLTPEQAVALLVQGRLRDFNEFSRAHSGVPSLTEAETSPQWSWRFVGALGHRLNTGEVNGLQPLVDDAPDSAARVASTVTAVAGLLENGRANDALTILETALARNEAEPVDHAWLTVQHARACAEIGRVDDARAAALKIQGIRVTHPDDVTASAIAGVAAVLLFNTSAWGQKEVADVITGMDTAAIWWRTQTMSWGLQDLAKRTFKAWARDKSVTLGGADTVNNYLLAASMMANHAGDHDGWRHLSSLLAQNALLQQDRASDPEKVRQELDTLRLAGDEAAIKLTVQQLAADGPAIAITLAARTVDLETCTRTTGPSSLALLHEGGDLLDETTADRSLNWLSATQRDPSRFAARTTTPSYVLERRLVEALAAVVLPASPTARHAVIDHLTTLARQSDQLLAAAWAQVVDALPDEMWDEEVALRLGHNADIHHDALRLPLLGLAAGYNTSAREKLVEETRAGSMQALVRFGDVRTLPTDVVGNLTSGLAQQVDELVRDAHRGKFGGGGYDVGLLLALLSVNHPSAAKWDSILNLLEDDAVDHSHKRGALRVLASSVDHIPNHVEQRLRSIAVTVAKQPSHVHHPMLGLERDARGAATDLAAALGALNDETSALHLLALLGGDLYHRQWAAAVARRLGRLEDIGMLVTLAQDPEPEVRGTAAAGLASMVAEERGGTFAAKGLQHCLSDPGTLVPISIAAALTHAPTRSRTAQKALTDLRSHLSARVRAAVGSSEQ